jgi:phenylalanyl-tRNA synthetase beta chain
VRKIKSILSSSAALAEVYNYSFVGEEQLKKLGINYANYIRLANPIASHQTMLRQNLAPNLLNAIKVNQARYEQFGLFEIGSVYTGLGGDISKGDSGGEMLPYQEKRLAIALAGKVAEKKFALVKGIIENLFAEINLPVVFKPTGVASDWANQQLAAEINIHDVTVGFIYGLSKEAAVRSGVKKNVVIAEISLKELFKFLLNQSLKKFQEFEKFPPVIRDLAFVVGENILYNDIWQEILSFHPYIKKVELFDVYQSEKLGLGNKNLAFSIIYQADKTLTTEEVDEIQKGLINKMEEKFVAKIRDF